MESTWFRSDPFRQRFTSVSTCTARTNRVRQPRLTTVPAATRSRLSHARRVRSHPPGLATSPRRVDSRVPRHVQPISHLGWFPFYPLCSTTATNRGPRTALEHRSSLPPFPSPFSLSPHTTSGLPFTFVPHLVSRPRIVVSTYTSVFNQFNQSWWIKTKNNPLGQHQRLSRLINKPNSMRVNQPSAHVQEPAACRRYQETNRYFPILCKANRPATSVLDHRNQPTKSTKYPNQSSHRTPVQPLTKS